MTVSTHHAINTHVQYGNIEKRRAAIVNLMFKQAEEIAEETNIARKKMKEHALKNSPYDDELGKSGGVVFRALS